MDIGNGVDGLNSLLGVSVAQAPSVQQSRSGASGAIGALDSDRATFSSAGSEVSLAASGSEVRTDKVAQVQAALAAGTYNVPASAVASKLVDAMLGGESQA